jgi:hypothetical protein
MAGKHHVSFTATKTVKKPTTVSFTTKHGEHVDFMTGKPAEQRIKVEFDAKNQ